MSDGLVTKEPMKRTHGYQLMNLTMHKKSFRISTLVIRTNPALFHDSFLFTLFKSSGDHRSPDRIPVFAYSPLSQAVGIVQQILFSRPLPRQNVQRLVLSHYTPSRTSIQYLRCSHCLWSSQTRPLVPGKGIWTKSL